MPSYTDDFLELWSCWLTMERKLKLGRAGTKMEAFAEWEKLDDLPPVEQVIEVFREQCKEKLAERRQGKDPQYFKNCCRWLKYRQWEVEDVAPNNQFLQEIEVAQENASLVNGRLMDLADRSWSH